jgi:Flp pilus assembly protein TadG
MRFYYFNSERGQVMVLLVLALVGLLAFTALAIDGGMVYSDRRTAQNAADTAALAGAGAAAQYMRTYEPANPKNNPVSKEKWNCGHGAISGGGGALAIAEGAAASRAGANDFNLSTDTSTDSWVDAQCHNTYLEVRVQITVETRSSLAHLIYKGPLVNTVKAVTKVDPSVPVGFGNSIIALTDQCTGTDKGIELEGDHDSRVKNGGVWSNSCIIANGSSGYLTVTMQTEGGEEEGEVLYLDEYKPNGNITDQISPEPTHSNDAPLSVDIDPPDCSSLGPSKGDYKITGPDKTGTISPGNYGSISVQSGESLTMQPGLYCISKNFNVSGILSGTDVTIYLTGENSTFSSGGSAEVNIDAPTPECESLPPSDPDSCYPALGGMLIYAEHGDVSLAGNAASHYEGTVYAPEGQISVGGNSDETSNIGAQLIGLSVKLHGSAFLDILYDDAVIYRRGPKVTLMQ